MKLEREKFYPRPGIKPGPLVLHASALPLRHPGQLQIQGRINLFEPILSDLRTTNSVVITSYRGPGLEPGPLVLHASALPLRHPGQLLNECKPLYDVKTTEFVVVLRSEIIGTKRLILPWICSCPGWRNGSALARKARGPGSIPGKG